jgi:hypothetical protein
VVDGYAARGIIQSPAASMLEEQNRDRLTKIASASGLGHGALPAELLDLASTFIRPEGMM